MARSWRDISLREGRKNDEDETRRGLTVAHGVVLWKVLQVTRLHSCKVFCLLETYVVILVPVDTAWGTRTRAGRIVTDIADGVVAVLGVEGTWDRLGPDELYSVTAFREVRCALVHVT
jgi:hypothetical protein